MGKGRGTVRGSLEGPVVIGSQDESVTEVLGQGGVGDQRQERVEVC